jgi:hypothetical protein
LGQQPNADQSADNPNADFGDEIEARGPLTLAEKLNGDLWWRFLNGPLSLFNGVGQSIRVDIYSYATIRTDHVLLHLSFPIGCLRSFPQLGH